MKKRQIFLIVLMVMLIMVPAATTALNSLDLSWQALTGGGGRLEGSGIALEGSFGQPVTGIVQVSSLELCSGFQCLDVLQRIYLPAAIKGGG